MSGETVAGAPIFKGATRPAMLFGIPLLPCLFVNMTYFLLFFQVFLIAEWEIPGLVIACAWILTFLWMRRVSRNDSMVFRQLYLCLRLKQDHNFNAGLWGRGITHFAAIDYADESVRKVQCKAGAYDD